MRRIALYAPMKPPDHPAPSGDRQIARLLMAALARAGHEVTLASRLRTYLRDPEDRATHQRLLAEAEAERAQIAAIWQAEGAPDLWLSYHPYRKSPDLLGPPLAEAHGVPLVTVEASYSRRRGVALWADFQDRALAAVRMAEVNIAFTARDAAGLSRGVPGTPIARLPPFIDAAPFLAETPRPRPRHLVTVAMMRPGDKAASYALLAAALSTLLGEAWHLTIVGDGPDRAAVRARFATLPPGRITWAGEQDDAGVRAALAEASAFLWPGTGEAFGLAYLEAQAMGLPVIAQRTAGVPEVVADGETGLLTPEADAEAYAAAVRRLLTDDALRRRLGQAARARVAARHSLDPAAATLEAALQAHVWTSPAPRPNG